MGGATHGHEVCAAQRPGLNTLIFFRGIRQTITDRLTISSVPIVSIPHGFLGHFGSSRKGNGIRNNSTTLEALRSSRTLVKIVLTEANPRNAPELEGGHQQS